MKVLIIGAGIGGLCLALLLHKRGVDCELCEQVPELRPLGVGLTLQTPAVAELVDLGLLPALDAVSIRSAHLYYKTRLGQGVWDEPRGIAAGFKVPQLFVHRGYLHTVLLDAVRARLPAGALRLGSRFVSYKRQGSRVEASVVDAEGRTSTLAADTLIGADGIHSNVRRQIHPKEGAPRWSGLMLWRGAVEWPEFLGGAAVMILGGVDNKFVAYPIAPGSTPSTKLTNWAVITRLATDGAQPPSRENWSAPGRLADLTPHLAKFRSDVVDLKGLIAATPEFWEYPMCDRDPVETWSDGCVTLLGDAAHPMYPMGANGASQAILDSRLLADRLTGSDDVEAAIAGYQSERIAKTTPIVFSNRAGGPEGVIDAVEARAPDGFADIEAVMPYSEREAIMSGYARRAGYAPVSINPTGAEATA
jgi:2-polyprenyl-6-methoxyphenol hydroxylase-like FAD-dependent oxidoreductase